MSLCAALIFGLHPLGVALEYFNEDFKTLGFLFESLCIRDLRIYSSAQNGSVSYYHDRYGLEADAVLHLEDGRYAEGFSVGEVEINGALGLVSWTAERTIIAWSLGGKLLILDITENKNVAMRIAQSVIQIE